MSNDHLTHTIKTLERKIERQRANLRQSEEQLQLFLEWARDQGYLND